MRTQREIICEHVEILKEIWFTAVIFAVFFALCLAAGMLFAKFLL